MQPLKIPTHDEIEAAIDLAEKGNLGKAFGLLNSKGMATGSANDIAAKLAAKHPPPPAQHGHGFSEGLYRDVLEDESREMHSRASWCTREVYAKVAMSQKPGLAADQWGWRLKEHLGPLMQVVEIGDLLMESIIVPILDGLPIRRGGLCLMGGSLIAQWKK